MKLSAILSKLSDVRREADGFVALCPAHADSMPSLRIARGSKPGALIVKCRAGCSTPDVLAALKLSMSDLFDVSFDDVDLPEARGGFDDDAELPIELTAALGMYAYRCHANLMATDGDRPDDAWRYLTLRFGLPLEAVGQFVIGVDYGEDEFPYLSSVYTGVPRLTVPFFGFDGTIRGLQARALAEHRVRWCGLSNPPDHSWSKIAVFDLKTGLDVILITEGPADALTAVGAGYDAVAIRGAGLAHKAAASLAEPLRDRQIIVCGDADRAGATFTAELGRELSDRGLHARSLELPHGIGDLNDWRMAEPEAFAERLDGAIKRAARITTPPPFEPPDEPDNGATEPQDPGDDLSDWTDEGAFPVTDLGNARRLHARLGGLVRYSPELGFFVWNGRHWRQDRLSEIRTQAQAMAMHFEDSGDKLLRQLGSKLNLDNMITELKSIPGVPVETDYLDRHSHLLACRNGVIDLRTGELREHDPDLLITKCLDLDYRPDAGAPRWESFIEEVLPQEGYRDFIRRLVGYGITGSTAEQCFVIMVGGGANGKSVFLDTLTTIFRPITVTTPFSTFEVRQTGQSTNDLAALKGARLVMASEGEAGRRMSESTLKRVTGRDRISAKFLYKEYFEFRPEFLLFLATNHYPKFTSQDKGLWRRMQIIEFPRYFEEHERDHYLESKLLAEAEGILAWAVRGSIDWYATGLDSPIGVRTQTQDFKATSDPLAGFFGDGEIMFPDPGGEVLGSKAYDAYREWATEEGLKMSETWTRNAFYREMRGRGFESKKRERGVVICGVGLRDRDDPRMTLRTE